MIGLPPRSVVLGLWMAALMVLCGTYLDGQLSVDASLDSELFVQPTGTAEDLRLIGRIAKAARIPVGLQESTVLLLERPGRPVLPARTVRQALNDWVRLDARYSWKDMNGVAVMRPHGAWSDERDPLNRRVGRIEWRGITVTGALVRVRDLLVSPSAQTLSSSQEGRLTVSVDGGRIIDVLNATAVAHGELAWTVATTRDSTRVSAILFGGSAPGGGPQTLSVGWLTKRP